jgi:hypothetical protein
MERDVKERPILFSAPMVRAILDGSKTQTRRVAKEFAGRDDLAAILKRYPNQCGSPYGEPGDRLWVRETWAARPDYDHLPPSQCGDEAVWWKASKAAFPEGYAACFGKWRPSIHMPRWASRILLEIVSVRVERLQGISEEDARAEGAKHYDPANHLSHGGWSHDGHYVSETAEASFERLWDDINGAGSWDVNPWVWVVEFKRVTP